MTRAIVLVLVFTIWMASPVRAELYMGMSGKVLDDATKAGVAGVEITAFKPTDKDTPFLHATTNQAGEFVFRGLTEGDYQLNVSPANAYVRTVTVANVPKGKNVTNIRIPLKKSGFISGKVLRADGTPVDKALLVAVSKEGFKSTATTKSDGIYAMRDLIPGNYKVYAMAENVSREFIIDIVVAEGLMTENVNIVLGALNQGIEGVVTDLAGNPIKEAVVFVSANGSQALGVTDASGHYRVQGLQAGAYMLTVFAPSYEGVIKEGVHVNDGGWTRGDFILAKSLQGFVSDSRLLVASLNGMVPDTANGPTPLMPVSGYGFNPAIRLARILGVTTLISATNGTSIQNPQWPWPEPDEDEKYRWKGSVKYGSLGAYIFGGSVFYINLESPCFDYPGIIGKQEYVIEYFVVFIGLSLAPPQLPVGGGVYPIVVTDTSYNYPPKPENLTGPSSIVTAAFGYNGGSVGFLTIGDGLANITGRFTGLDVSADALIGFSRISRRDMVDCYPCFQATH